MILNLYLTFDGNAEEAINFYASALGGKVAALMRFGDIPDWPDMPDHLKDRLAHARLVTEGGTVMVSDTADPTHPGFAGFSVQTTWPNVAQAQAAFDKIAQGGAITMPFAPTFWAAGFGTVTDKFGVGWMFNCEAET